MPVTDRDYRLIEHTVSFCPECERTVPAKIVEKEGSVFLLKQCPVHGSWYVLREKNARFYTERLLFDKPGTRCLTQTTVAKGCPFDCGLCPEHEQHTCIGVIEITGQCNLSCPSCYAAPHNTSALDIAQLERMIDFLRDSEHGAPEVLQISGGEPTLHPALLDILRLAMTKGFKYVMLNTNGIRIAEDPAFAQSLSKLGSGFEVYLQYDGMTPETSTALRGKDLTEVRRTALKHLAAACVPITLVSTIEKGINDHEIGAVLESGMDSPMVRGINFQPMAFFREPASSAGRQRITMTEILEQIETQTSGGIRVSDFIPLPCNVDRVALTFFYRSGRKFVPITRKVDFTKHLEHLRNTFAFHADEFVAKATGIGSGDCCAVSTFLKSLRPLIPVNYAISSKEERVHHFNTNVFRISVTSFVDREDFDLRSVQKECVHVITPDLKKIPFSTYNMFHRWR